MHHKTKMMSYCEKTWSQVMRTCKRQKKAVEQEEGMKDCITLTGMVLTSSPMKEYDRRIELLSRERGRISAFAQGARKSGSALSGCTIPLIYGKFVFYEGKNSYSLRSASIQKSFGEIAEDYDKTCYAAYFSEMIRYLCKENMEASDELLLLYITLQVMQRGNIPLKLIRIVFEMRMLMLSGQGIELFECLECGKTGCHEVYFQAGGLLCEDCKKKHEELKNSAPFVISPDALYTLQFILSSKLGKLYSFLVSDEVLEELVEFMKIYMKKFLPYKFKSLEFLS